MRSVVVEGLVLGLIASVIGLVVGYAIAKGMIVLVDAFGVDLPKGSTVLAWHTVLASMAVGTGITLLASILPARRATRVPPIAAVREGATLPPTKLAEQSHNAGVAVTVASLAAIAVGLFAGGVSPFAAGLLLGGGVLALFAGIALLAPGRVKPLAQVVGWPARRSGAAGELAVANAVRHPGRTASTAATLMIGLTLVTVVAVLGSGLRASTERGVSDQLTAGYVIDGTDGQSFDAAHGEKLAAVAGVRTASHVRTDNAIVQGAEKAVSAVDPASIAQVYSFTWTAGSEGALARLRSDGALLTNGYAHRAHLRVGRHVAVKTPKGDRLTL